jgi:3-oxoacyl-[acyl-carrier-protein] synthase-3
MQAFIKAITFYLPEVAINNEQLEVIYHGWTALKKTIKVTGVHKRQRAKDDESVSDMAIKAAEQLFKEYNIDKRIVDFVILCTQTEDYFLPATACVIQNKLGLSTSCGALDIKLGCSGFVYGLSLAKGLIAGGIAKNILLLTGDVLSKIGHPEDKGNFVLSGDAASATLISTEGFAEIGNFSLGTDGSGAENVIIRTRAFRHLSLKNDFHIDEFGRVNSSDHCCMDGGEIFNFTISLVPKLIKDTLAKNSVDKSDIHLFVFHQPSKYVLDFLRDITEIDEDKFYYCISESGNTSSSTIPIALCNAKKDNLLHNNVLIAGFGVGLSWAGCILKVEI